MFWVDRLHCGQVQSSNAGICLFVLVQILASEPRLSQVPMELLQEAMGGLVVGGYVIESAGLQGCSQGGGQWGACAFRCSELTLFGPGQW